MRIEPFISWIMQNWFYAVAAVSLALAGIFLVIYGAEQGLMPPSVRILAALVLGVALVGAGEVIRRRSGDAGGVSTVYLPSTLAGAGIVVLFATVLAARLLYGFTGPGVTLVGMGLVGGVAIVLGWFYGPLLAAVGILGATLAPFVIGGSSDDPSWLLAYFAIVTIVGLAIDTLRRWAWVSVLSLAAGFTAGLLLVLGADAIVAPWFVIYCAVLALAAIAIPVRRLEPDHQGTPLSLALFAHKTGEPWPEFPTRLAGAAVVAASGLILMTTIATWRADLFWTGIIALAGLTLALLVWARHAPALTDLAAVPAAALVVLVAKGAQIWSYAVEAAQEPEAGLPLMPTMLVAIGLAISIAAAWRSLRGGPATLFVAAGAALMAPALAIAIEVFWTPAAVLDPFVWALHAMVISAVMIGMATRFARVDGPGDRLRVSLAILSALACIAFGLVILFSSGALTVALAVTVVVAAWLDRRYDLPLMGSYIVVGIATIGYRLVADPGLGWAIGTTLPDMLLSYGGAVVAFAVSWILVKAAGRPRSEVLLESAVFSSVGMLLSLLLYRAILQATGDVLSDTGWSVGLNATIWLALGMAQLRRLKIGGALRRVRMAMGTLFLVIGAVQVLFVVVLGNPLLDLLGSPVRGPVLLNTLIPTYLLPALILLAGAVWLRGLNRRIRILFAGSAVALAILWLGLMIRHAWRGSAGMPLPGVGQGELYTYTVVILIVGAGLFYQSLARRSALLRRAGLVVIGIAVAKVFVVDIGGLTGLTRVFSLLVLGLALAGLAWLNRWASTTYTKAADR